MIRVAAMCLLVSLIMQRGTRPVLRPGPGAELEVRSVLSCVGSFCPSGRPFCGCAAFTSVKEIPGHCIEDPVLYRFVYSVCCF